MEITKIRPETKELENSNRINKSKIFGKINKMNKLLVKLLKKIERRHKEHQK